MGKFLEVQEFDRICCNPDYKGDNSYGYKYMPEGDFRALEHFIHVFSGDEEHADALEFMRIGYRRGVGSVITMSNYVGLIQTSNGHQIQVLPKIDFTDANEAKDIFLKMLRSMKDFPSKVFTNSNLNVSQMTLYEVFINMYLQEVNQMVKRGLKSAYISEEDNLNVFKGKLHVGPHIRHNLVHKERFYVGFDEYNLNRSENRLIKSTLLKLNNISESATNTRQIRQLLAAFELVEPSDNYEQDFSKVVVDRSTRDYENLMKWSKVFLKNKSFTTFSGETSARALLFPMEKVFESYVARQLKIACQHDDWDISLQDHHFYLFNEPHRQFALRPDIVMKDSFGNTVVLDTKWKKLSNNSRINYGISQADMYQMYAYSKKYHAGQVILLYPLSAEMMDHPPIYFQSDDGVSVRVFFVDLKSINDSLAELKSQISNGI